MVSGKKNIAVLMGGISPEKEISLKSGRAIANALRKTNNNVIEIIVKDEEVNELDDYKIDVAFIALHGYFGEDGGVQKVLESKGIPYTGSGVAASGLAMDKLKSKDIFLKNGIPTPDYISISCTQNIHKILENIEMPGLPVIVKPINAGSSVGISIITDAGKIEDGINHARPFGKEVLIEKYIEGRELTVSILDNKPLPVIEIKPATKFYDYDSKYKDDRTRYIILKSGEKASEDTLPHSTYSMSQDLAIRAHNSLGCKGFSRVDMVLGKDNIMYVLEVNTIPGFTERSLLPKAAKAAKIDFINLCNTIINEKIH